MLEWVAGQGGGAALQQVIERALKTRQEENQLLDEICGQTAARATRRAVRDWLARPSTAHLLGSTAFEETDAPFLILKDLLGALDDAPDPQLIVSSARRALANRQPIMPVVADLHQTVVETTTQHAAALGALADDTRQIRSSLDHLLGPPTSSWGTVEGPRMVGVPDLNVVFQGREQELARLARELRATAPDITPFVLVGLGGIGKTAVATQLCHRLRDEYDLIRWLSADDRKTLEMEVLHAARAIGIDVYSLSPADAFAGIRHWFEQTSKRWLLIFDNVDSPETLEGLVPRQGVGAVVITSRHRDWPPSTGVKPLPIRQLSEPDATSLLQRLSGRQEDQSAVQLVRALGCLPLAIVQSAAYVRQAQMSLAEYRVHLETRAQELLARNPARLKDKSNQDITVVTVWDASVERATEEAEGASAVLSVMAYTSPDALPRALFTHATASSESLLQHGDELFLTEGVAALARYCLIEHRRRSTGEPELSVHRLVQGRMRLTHADGGRADEWCALALRLVDRYAPTSVRAPRSWARLERLGPHIITATAYARRAGIELDTAASLLGRFGLYLRYSGTPLAAPSILEDARSLAAQAQGTTSPDALAIGGHLASAYWAAGRLDEAVDLQVRLLRELSDARGTDHPDTLAARHNMAATLWSRGDISSALKIGVGVVAARMRVLGYHHPDTLMSMHNFAHALWSAGRVTDAIRLQESVAAMRGRTLGYEDADTLTTLSALSLSYWSAGRVAKAVALQRRVIKDRTRVLGAHHPDTMMTQYYLARSYRSMGRIVDALGLSTELCDHAVRVLGARHPTTLAAKNELAECLRDAGRPDEASRLSEAVLADRQSTLGAHHPDTIASRAALASSYLAAGQSRPALQDAEAAAAAMSRCLGAKHPQTLTCRHILASCYLGVGRVDDARRLLASVLIERVELLGDDHPDSIRVRQDLMMASGREG